MIRFFVFLMCLSLLGCGDSKLDGTYSNNITGVAEQKVSFTFKRDGTMTMGVGSTLVPLEMPYEIRGKEIKARGQNGDLIFTILDNGDLITEGLRLTKESSTKPEPKQVTSATISPVETAHSSRAPIEGIWKGEMDGGIGEMRVERVPAGFKVVLSVSAAPNCGGAVDGLGKLVDSALTITKKGEGDTACKISVVFAGNSATTKEEGCGEFHSGSCTFDGSLKLQQ